MKPTTLLCWAACIAACANTPPAIATDQPGNPKSAAGQELDRRLAASRTLLAENPEGALQVALGVLKEHREDGRARALAVECLLRMDGDPAYGDVRESLTIALANLRKTVDDQEDEPAADALLLLADGYRRLGELDDAFASAERAARGFAQRKGQANQRAFRQARFLMAECDYRRFTTARQAELDAGTPDDRGLVELGRSTQTLALRAFEAYHDAEPERPADCITRTAWLHQWLSQPSEALRELERGIHRYPSEAAIHDAYQRLLGDLGQFDAMAGAYGRMVKDQPELPALRWHRARALYAGAGQRLRDGNFLGAAEQYRTARDAFDDYLAQMPAHEAAAREWQALCDLQMARCAVDGGDFDRAEQLLLRGDRTSTALATGYERDFTETVFRLHLAATQLPHDALARTLAFDEAVLQRHPDRWGWVHNNAALAARDLGVQRDRAGDHAAAIELWERSYHHYERAVALAPDDARIANDCGLMLLFHLHRDLDHARELFDRAAELGRAQLARLSDDADVGERQRLEEAVGDALQNTAMLLAARGRPRTEQEPFLRAAVEYYPGQRREAAAMLRTPPQGSAAETFQKQLPAVQQHIDRQDYDSALTTLDAIQQDCREHAPYQLLVGRVNWLLGNQARDTGRSGVEFFYQDAAKALRRAVELDAEAVEPRQLLAQAQYDAGDLDGAAETLATLLLHLQSLGGGEPAQRLAAHRLRANVAARAYAAKKQGGEDDAALLTAARSSMRYLEQEQALDTALLQTWSTTEQWAGAPAEAVQVWLRASSRAPTDFGLLDAVVNTAAAQQQLPLAIDGLAKRDDAGTQWYRGKAHWLLAGALREQGKADDALAALGKAKQDFAASMRQNDGFRDSCEQWLAMCLGKEGNIALQQGKLDVAEARLLEAVRLRPDRLYEDLGLLETIKGGLLGVVDKHYRKNDLQKVEAISRAAAEAATGDVDLQNNSGLFARDWGNQLERQGKKAAADEMYEQSYKSYQRAVRLDPQNVQLRNDCALIAIYHLDRDWDESKALLDAAIADGQKRLSDDPPNNDDEKAMLISAVGDALENLALWHLKHSHDAKAAKEAAQQSLQYPPPTGQRGNAHRHLQAAERMLQGK